jgi:hypothetical protein
MDKKETKGQNMIYKTLHRKLKIEQHEPNLKPVVVSGAQSVHCMLTSGED